MKPPHEDSPSLVSKTSAPIYLVFSDPEDPKAPSVCARVTSLTLCESRSGDWQVVFVGLPGRRWTPSPAHPDGILMPFIRRGRRTLTRYRRVGVESAFDGPVYRPEFLAELPGFWAPIDQPVSAC